MDTSIGLELESVLNELERLNTIVAQKERALNKVKSIYLNQVGTQSYELVINDQIFTMERNDLNLLLEQMQDAGVFSKLAEAKKSL
jgi:hypothetical protein